MTRRLQETRKRSWQKQRGGGESEEGAGEGAEGWGMRVADRHEAIQVLRLLASLVQKYKY